MATGTIMLDVKAATPPDGSTGNAGPKIRVRQGTEANPKKHVTIASFDAATAQFLWWTFRCPTDYASGGTVKVPWVAAATSATAVRWAARLGAVTPADADTPVEHAAAAATAVTSNTNTVEAGRLTEATIALGALDGLAAGDMVSLCLFRDAADALDTLAVDADLWEMAVLEYTTV